MAKRKDKRKIERKKKTLTKYEDWLKERIAERNKP